MERRRQIIEREPLHIIELVRFSVFYLHSVHEHLEVQRNPMGLLAVILSMNVAVAEELTTENVRAILFLNFFL